MKPIEAPTVIIGKTQSGKTYRASRLFEATEPPTIFCDIQWRRYAEGTVVYTVEEIIDVLHADPKSKVWWLLDNYAELDQLVEYLYTVHKAYNLKGVQTPNMVIFLDEVWRVADRWSDMSGGANKLFAECFQHHIYPVAISQWVGHMHKLIITNAYDLYIFSLSDHDIDLLRKNYGIDIPDDGWIENPRDHHYYIYDQMEFKKYDEHGQLVGSEKAEKPEDAEEEEEHEDMSEMPPEEPEDGVHNEPPAGLSEDS